MRTSRPTQAPSEHPRAGTAHRLAANRVPMMYAGGENIDRFRGERSTYQSPEDWVGSTRPLLSLMLPPEASRDTGISLLPDGTSLKAAMVQDPDGWLGPKLASRWAGDSGLLVKLLDAGERLPVHWHPSRAFATAHLDSPFGKTEGWIVMDAAPGSHVWLGFREAVSETLLTEWVESQAADKMLAAMNRLEATAGSVFYVPAGVPHAIGPGVMITELQEPTSFSVHAEYAAFGLDEQQATLGLGWPLAIASVDRSGYDVSRLAELVPQPQTIKQDRHGRVTRLFGEESGEFFQALRAFVEGPRELPESFVIMVVEAGLGTLEAGGEVHKVNGGETWILPFAAGPARIDGSLRVIVCPPPEAARSVHPAHDADICASGSVEVTCVSL